jgi:hypothetical protein
MARSLRVGNAETGAGNARGCWNDEGGEKSPPRFLRGPRDGPCASSLMSILRLDLFLLRGDGNVFVLNIQPQPVVDADVVITDPNQSEKRNHVSAPIRKYQFEAGDYEKDCRHVVTETIFAREQVKELPAYNAAALLALSFAEIADFLENRFVRHRPRNRCSRTDNTISVTICRPRDTHFDARRPESVFENSTAAIQNPVLS